MKGKQKDKQATNDVEFYHRRWQGNGFHSLKNKIGGAFGITKKEWHRMIEDRNRQANLKKKDKKWAQKKAQSMIAKHCV